MATLNKLTLNQRPVMRNYQEPLVAEIINNFNSYIPFVLGSAPSSGKTEMAIEAIIRLYEMGLVKKVLILAHLTNVLKKNFYERLQKYFHEEDIAIMEGKRRHNFDAMVQVMIPQNLRHIQEEFDLLVVDEAQHNVLVDNGSYQQILDITNPKLELFLTGTPSKFILKNNIAERDGQEPPYKILAIGMDKIGFEHFHDVRFDLIKSAYKFTAEDYNRTHDISEDVKFSFAQTETTVHNVIVGAVRNIALRLGITLPKTADCIKEAKKLIKSSKFGKTLIMCRRKEQADQVAKILENLFHCKIHVSHSENDDKSLNLEDFKKGKFPFLCVVNRAREGYDDETIANIIDLTLTHNIDLIYQMFCRATRKDKNNPNSKLYLKVTSNAEGIPKYTMQIMTAAIMLAATENLEKFNGKNFRGIVMPDISFPDIEESEKNDLSVRGNVKSVGSDGQITMKPLNGFMAMDLVKMFVDDHENLICGNDRYAMTTLGEALDVLKGDVYDVSSIEECVVLSKKYGIVSSADWIKKYKNVGGKEEKKLPCEPWNTFDLEGGQIEFSKRLGTFCDFDVTSIEECVALAKKYEIISAKAWIKNCKVISEKERKKLPFNPWKTFDLEGEWLNFQCYSMVPMILMQHQSKNVSHWQRNMRLYQQKLG